MRKVLFVALMLCGAAATAGTPLPDGPHVVVEGSANVEAKADSAKVVLLFSHRADTALAAKQAVDAAVNRYIDTLYQFDIAPKQVEAPNVSVSPVDDDEDHRGKNRTPGFEAERRVTAVLGDVTRLDALLDAGLGDGATEVISVGFQVRDPAALRREAKRRAIADAKVRANDSAEAAGATLGAVYSIDSARSRQVESYGYGRSLDAVQVTGGNVRPGQYLSPGITVSESVSVVFELRR